MGSLSPLHWLLVLGIALVLFGSKGRFSRMAADLAQGIKAFRSGVKDEPEQITRQ